MVPRWERPWTRRLTPRFSHPEGITVGWPVVVVGGWCPVGRHVEGVGLTLWHKIHQLTFEVGMCLDLYYLAPRPKEPLGLGPVACPAF